MAYDLIRFLDSSAVPLDFFSYHPVECVSSGRDLLDAGSNESTRRRIGSLIEYVETHSTAHYSSSFQAAATSPPHVLSRCLLTLVSTRGHFEGQRVGTPFPLLKSCRNAWGCRCHCESARERIMDGIQNHFPAKNAQDGRIFLAYNLKISVVIPRIFAVPPMLGPRHYLPFGSPAFLFYETTTKL